MNKTRAQAVAAMMMIGDGVFAAVTPRRHAARWKGGPSWWRRFLESFRERPKLTRLFGLAEIAVGIAWARRMRPRST